MHHFAVRANGRNLIGEIDCWSGKQEDARKTVGHEASWEGKKKLPRTCCMLVELGNYAKRTPDLTCHGWRGRLLRTRDCCWLLAVLLLTNLNHLVPVRLHDGCYCDSEEGKGGNRKADSTCGAEQSVVSSPPNPFKDANVGTGYQISSHSVQLFHYDVIVYFFMYLWHWHFKHLTYAMDLDSSYTDRTIDASHRIFQGKVVACTASAPLSGFHSRTAAHWMFMCVLHDAFWGWLYTLVAWLGSSSFSVYDADCNSGHRGAAWLASWTPAPIWNTALSMPTPRSRLKSMQPPWSMHVGWIWTGERIGTSGVDG